MLSIEKEVLLTFHFRVGYDLIYSGVLLGCDKSQGEKFRYLCHVPGRDLEVPCKVPMPTMLLVRVRKGLDLSVLHCIHITTGVQ